MKYLLFAGHRYYPVGGIDDLKGVFDLEWEAFKYLNEITRKNFDNYGEAIHWFQIVLLNDGRFETLHTDMGYKPTGDEWVKKEVHLES